VLYFYQFPQDTLPDWSNYRMKMSTFRADATALSGLPVTSLRTAKNQQPE
jgi:hypothetical protein